MRKILLALVVIIGLSSFTTYSPLKVEGEKIILRLNNLNHGKVSIKVSTLEGEILYSQKTSDSAVGKVFNFEDAYADTYVVEVYNDGHRYREIIEIK